MRKLLSLFAFLFILNINLNFVIAQSCLPGSTIFNTQEQIDDFAIDNPGCTEILGNLLFLSSGESNLDMSGFSNIQSVQGDIVFQSNNSFTNFIGFENLDSLHGSLIIENSSLTSFEGLESLNYIGNNFQVEESSNFSGFDDLSSLNYIGGNFWVNNDSSIPNFIGLEQLTTIGASFVLFESSIQSFQGLNSLTEIGDYVTFRGNLFSDFTGLNSLQSIEGGISISSTIANSMSGLENLNLIGGGIFIDDNQNLTSLYAMTNLSIVNGTNFVIRENPLLQECTLEAFCNLYANADNVDIANNGTTCTLFEIIDPCIDLGFTYSCLPGDNFFHTQGAIDSFSINNPGCTDVLGGFIFTAEGDESLNMSGFVNINSIGGDLALLYNNSFDNFIGLENLDSLYGTFYTEHSSISSFEGLNNLKYIGGTLEVDEGSNIASFDHLDNLNYIDGGLQVIQDSLIQNFEGLEQLTTINGGLTVYSSVLQSFQGLNNVDSIGAFSAIHQNQINDFSGLDNLASIGGWGITSTTATSLIGLENLTSISGDFYITDNLNLLSVNSLSNLSEINGLVITNNPLLNECDVIAFCNFIVNVNTATISGNDTNCNSANDILDSCNDLGIAIYYIFYDENGNNVFDNSEILITEPGLSIQIEPGNCSAFPTSTSPGIKSMELGDYQISLNQNPESMWGLTGSTNSYDVSFDLNDNIDTLYFGLLPLQFISEFVTFINAPSLRCNEFVTVDILGKNLGTTVADGIMYFTIDPEILDVEFIDQPDTIIAPYTYGWAYEDLFPGQNILKQIRLQIPGPFDLDIGSFINFQSYMEYEDANGFAISIPNGYRGITECSYDPNDKLINPDRMNGYTLFEEDLIYTIRFQNTGNAEAYDVVIRDTLDANLDPTTFQVISSSHETVLSTFLEDNQYLTFEYKNIFLPDSTSDFEGSQGYVNYQIRTIEGLPEETEINNTAGIYFDLNPPVITNTTNNVMLSTFDFDEDGYEIFVDCDDMNEDVYPDAEDIPNNGIDEDCDGEDNIVGVGELANSSIRLFPNPVNETLQVFIGDHSLILFHLNDITGRRMMSLELTKEQGIDVSNLVAGVYSVLIFADGEVFSERIVKL